MKRRWMLVPVLIWAVGCSSIEPHVLNDSSVPAIATTSEPEPVISDHLPNSASESPALNTLTADGPLTLAAVEAMATASNPTLLQARAHIDGTLGMALQAGLWPNPTLGYSGELIGSEGTAGEFQGGYLQQEIITAKKRRLSREKYLARSQAAEFVALAQQYRVVNDIRRQYARAVGAARLVEIHEQMLKNAQDRLVTTQEMFNVGQANTVTVRLTHVALQRAKLDLQAAVNDRDQARRELDALVGVPLPAGPLADSLDVSGPPLAWESSLAYTLAESPEVREAMAKLNADRITLERERREPIPNVVVQAGPGYDFTQNRTVVNAGAFIKVPLWDRNQGTIQQAQADLMRQQAEQKRIELRLSRDLADAGGGGIVQRGGLVAAAGRL